MTVIKISKKSLSGNTDFPRGSAHVRHADAQETSAELIAHKY